MMSKKEIIAIILVILFFAFGLLFNNDNIVILAIIFLPGVFIFPFRNASAEWFWIPFIILAFTTGLKVNNTFLEDFRNVVLLTVLVYALRKSFFVKKNK